MAVCIQVSLLTSFPGAEQVIDQANFNRCIIKQRHRIRPCPAIIRRTNDADVSFMWIVTDDVQRFIHVEQLTCPL